MGETNIHPSAEEGAQDVPFFNDDGGKNLQNEIKIEMPNMEELAKSIKKLTKTLDNVDDCEQDTRMYIGGKRGKKYISDDKNKKLSDLEIFERSLNEIKKYEEETGRQAPIPPKFVAYMEDFVRTVGGGAMTIPEYKKTTIYREMNLANIKNLK